jgi:hypothetical protein
LRLAATRSTKVQPGDEVIVRAALSSGVQLARLYVWAKQIGDAEFSPYVHGLSLPTVLLNNTPQMHKPLSMRLVGKRRSDKISFMSDISGEVVVIQEVDTKNDKVANAKIELIMAGGWLERFIRRITEWPKTVTL